MKCAYLDKTKLITYCVDCDVATVHRSCYLNQITMILLLHCVFTARECSLEPENEIDRTHAIDTLSNISAM